MNIYDKRWNAVLSFFKDRLLPAMAEPHVDTFYEGIKISTGNIIIAERSRVITVDSENCQFVVYNGSPDWDEGAHDKTSDTIARLEESFKLYTSVCY